MAAPRRYVDWRCPLCPPSRRIRLPYETGRPRAIDGQVVMHVQLDMAAVRKHALSHLS